MKLLPALAGALVLAASLPVPANPKDVTRLEIATYRNSVVVGCRAQGQRAGDPLERVDRRCKCIEATLGKRLSEDEWKRATWFAQQGRDRDEGDVLAPHAAVLKACGSDAKK